jgi:ATP-dependent Lon protease
MTAADGAELQRVLEASDPEVRLRLALEMLTKAREMAKLQRDIAKQVEDKMSKQQREYFLREQLKSIKQELGQERDDKDELLATYQEKIAGFEAKGLDIKEPMRVMKEESKKLSNLEKNSPEFNVTRSYLDWLTSIPWGTLHEDRLNLEAASEELDRDHFGLEEIKKSILEFIAVGKLKGTVAGKIICFIGPPGTYAPPYARALCVLIYERKRYS